MSNNLKKAFKNIVAEQDLAFLTDKVIIRINREQEKRRWLQVVISRAVGSLSFIALFPLIIKIFYQLQTSGFWNYLSLLFTDTGAVAVYWKEFSMSLAESLPILQVTSILVLILTLLVSLRFALRDYKKIGMSASLI